MHTDYHAVARQLELLADGFADADTCEDLKSLARNVRMIGVMTRVLVDARHRRRNAQGAAAPLLVGDPIAHDVAVILPGEYSVWR